MRIWLNKYFGFSKGEFNGLMLLILIIGVLKSFPLIYNYYKPIEKDDDNLLASIQKITITDEENFRSTRDKIENSSITKSARLFKFDPNTIDVDGWQTLGLSQKQAQPIVNYRNKGGKFYKAEDLQRMYTISPEMYKSFCLT
ncbi:ComEA family DNA-binding protein [Pedobacter jamesrossensis]|uniref:ComEA family DNA-binding protein n=2 Tax=Pedobacter jamesrossensis TaxID=1908238 RepID=A0ABV8NJZ1_9SPHI